MRATGRSGAGAATGAASNGGAGGLALGIDAGGSSTRWLLLDAAGEVVGSGRVGPVSAIDLKAAAGPSQDPKTAASPAHDSSPLANLAALTADVLAVGSPARVVAGVTGLDAGSPAALGLEAFLAARLGLEDSGREESGRQDGEREESGVSVLGDVVIAYLAAFAPGEGVLVYAGTGSVALHLSRDGSAIRAGGHGYLLDDAGGGYWIGREALKRVLRRADLTGAPPGGALATALYADLGGSDWQTVRAVVYGGGRSRVAALTPLVARAASRGDPDALAVLAAAGSELARLANVISGRLGQALPVALAGGVARCAAPLLEPLAAALPAGASFTVADRPPVEAAAELARRLLLGTASLPPLPLATPPG